MKVLDIIISAVLIVWLVFITFGNNVYNIHDIPATQAMPTDVPLYDFMETVFIYPDSIKATIENGFFVIHKSNKRKIYEVNVELYHILYIDKTGKINRLKNVKPYFFLGHKEHVNK